MSSNVYADAGLENPELWLQKGNVIIAIRGVMRDRGLTNAVAARTLGISEVAMRTMIKGHVRDVDLAHLVDCLQRLRAVK